MEALVSLYWLSSSLHPKEPSSQLSHKSTKGDPIRLSRTWKKFYQIVFPCAFVIFSLTFSVPWHRWLEHDGCCLCFFVLMFFSFLLQAPLTFSYKCIEIILFVAPKFFRREETDHYCVDFLGKWSVLIPITLQSVSVLLYGPWDF